MVTIEPLGPAEFDSVARWLAKPDLNQWLTGDWRSTEPSPGLVAVAVRNRKNRFFVARQAAEAVGLVAFSDIEVIDRTAMVWYVLGKQELGGKGIITEAVRQLTSIGFDEMQLASVYAWVKDGNIASRRVLQKAGFREAGRIRRASSFGGEQVDRLYFDLVPSDRSA